MKNEPLEVTLKVTEFFESLGVPHFISGSLASTPVFTIADESHPATDIHVG